jgi:uncharacterized membrane protein
MNAAQLHLALNHLPLFATIFGLLILLAALARNSRPLQQAGLWLCLAAAVGAVPTYLAGEPAEEVIAGQPGFEEAFVEEHEEMALIALIGVEILGAASLAGLYLSRHEKTPPRWVLVGCVLLSLGSLAILGWTAHLGGQIRHPELRPGFHAAPGVSAQPSIDPPSASN